MPTRERTKDRLAQFDLQAWNESVYERFISSEADLQCNFPQDITRKFEVCYKRGVPPTQEMIFSARQHVVKLLLEVYRQFLSSVNSNKRNYIIEEEEEEDIQSIMTDISDYDYTSLQQQPPPQDVDSQRQNMWSSTDSNKQRLEKSTSLGGQERINDSIRYLNEEHNANVKTGHDLRKSKTIEAGYRSNKFLDSSRKFLNKLKIKSKKTSNI